MTTVFVIGAVIYIVLRFRREVLLGYAEAKRMSAPIKSRVFPTPPQFVEILQRYFVHYRNLSEGDKRKFEQRVTTFIYNKQFIPRGGYDGVSNEMRVLIAASAIQLTFGLPHIYLRHFRKILIYPDNYYSNITKQYHKGEVNPAYGIIVLSWKNFIEGYLDTTNAINLGLHEMAHALRLENIIRNDEYQFFDPELLEQFDGWAHKVCSNTEIQFFRSYACTTVHEFFSVAVENFFERPQEFKRVLPELYEILSKLLRQDPILLYQNNSQ